MDPITILGAVGTTLKIVKEVCEGLQWMQRVWENITHGDKILQSIALECNIYGESIKAIGQWLKKNKDATGLKRQMRTTHNAITLVQVSMANLLLDLKKVQESGDRISVKDRKISKEKLNLKMFQQFMINGAKQQWFQETMRIHLVELRAHAATLHLTLGVIELTDHTPELKEKTPDKLKDKTGQLEKRLLLRQLITKALEMKRAEIAELAKGDKSERLPLKPPITSSSGLIRDSPQKLTFYDVVQLARQQALAEKAQMSNENSISLSDKPQPVLNEAPSSTIQEDHDLLSSSNSVALQQIYPCLLSSQNESGTSKLNQIVELTGNRPASPEMDITLSQKPSGMDLLELVDPQASPAGEIKKDEDTELLAPMSTSNQPISPPHQSSEALASQEINTKGTPAAFEFVDPEAFHANNSYRQDANELLASPTNLIQPSFLIHQSSAALIGQGENSDEAPTDISPTSTAAPSIFSHSSSLSSATGYSLPEITEEDVQARNSSLHGSIKVSSFTPNSSPTLVRRKALGSARPLISKSSVQGNEAELCRSSSTSAAPAIQADSELLSKPQRTHSEDSVSQSSTLPLLSNIDEPDKQGFPWIVSAAHDGNEEMIRKLLGSGADIKATHATTRRHALSEASMQGHQKIVDLLIEEGCPLEYPDTEGSTALHHACQRGYLAIAKSLISHGALIDAPNPQGQTALHLAIQVPHQNVVMLLIQHKASVYARDASFRTPLHIGASQGNVAMCNFLLNEGAQLDSREAQSKTPLQLACEAGHYELVQMMLSQSNLNPTNMTFLTAFFAAVEYGHVQIAESFFPRGLNLQELKMDSHKPATLAAKSGGLDMVDLMIKENCDMYATDENKWNALHFASYYGHYQAIERLIANDVSTKAITSRNETPLLFAVKGGHFPVAERLLRSNKEGNLVGAEDEQGEQPVHHTARTGSVEIFNLLMSNGAKINVENTFGWQPLHIATAYGHLALVQRLLQQGANIEEKLGSSSIKKDQTHKIVEDGYWAEARWPYPGSRPLHLACEYGHYHIASHLISKGAKMEATCSEGWQPLHHAAYIGSSALVEMLLASGVYPHATTNEGKTAQGLQFCTSGTPILEEEKERIRNLLREAMERARKQKSFKVALKRGGTVEEKNNLIRAVTFSMMAVSRPHAHRAMISSTRISDPPPLTPSPPTSSAHRPPLARLPHTSPLPSTQPRPVSTSHSPPTSLHPTASQSDPKLPVPSPVTNSNLPNQKTTASEQPPPVNSATDPLPPVPSTVATPTPITTTETQVSVSPQPKIKRRTTAALASLSKVKPGGLDMGKLGLAGLGLGKQTMDIGKQTLELGKQGIEIGKQGFEIGKQGIEIGKQGIEMGKQGIEMGKQGIEIGKQGLEIMQGGGIDVGRQGIDIGKLGYKKAKKFAKKRKGKGKRGEDSSDGKVVGGKGTTTVTRRGKARVGGRIGVGDGVVGRDVDDAVDGTLDFVFGKGHARDDGDNDNDDDEIDDDNDDGDEGSSLDSGEGSAGSVFSLGEFAELGNNDF